MLHQVLILFLRECQNCLERILSFFPPYFIVVVQNDAHDTHKSVKTIFFFLKNVFPIKQKALIIYFCTMLCVWHIGQMELVEQDHQYRLNAPLTLLTSFAIMMPQLWLFWRGGCIAKAKDTPRTQLVTMPCNHKNSLK